jgi:hypothetical protein
MQFGCGILTQECLSSRSQLEQSLGGTVAGAHSRTSISAPTRTGGENEYHNDGSVLMDDDERQMCHPEHASGFRRATREFEHRPGG